MSSKDVLYSFIVITYKRDDILPEQFSVLKNIDSSGLMEVVFVDNNEDEIDRSILISDFKFNRYVKLYKNLGVTGGRNAGIKAASGKYLVFLDDDAIFVDPEKLLNQLNVSFSNPKIAAVAFKSINYYTRAMASWEFPHADKNKMNLQSFYTYQFIGVGHAIDRDWLGDFLYDESYFYSMEEFDLCFWLINKGGVIMYNSDISVLHKIDQSGRITPQRKHEKQLSNKMKNNYKYLPVGLMLFSSGAWMFYTLLKTKSLLSVLRGTREFIGWKKSGAKRTVLTKEAMRYLRSVGANLV